MSKLYEDESPNANPLITVVLYDDLLRRSIAQRAEAKDPSLDLDVGFGCIDKPILETCKTRSQSALAAQGLRGSQLPPQGIDVAGAALSKQTAAAEAATQKADQATRALERATAQAHGATSAMPPKRQQWMDDKKAWKKTRQEEHQDEEQQKGRAKGKGKGKWNTWPRKGKSGKY